METLAARVARDGGLPEIDAVGWAIRVARSVEQIHESGRVHGRLSADGILIDGDRCASEGRLIPFAELPENVAYHSPERERGEGGSQPDDTWAVAVTLYLALSGSLPFSGSSDAEVRRKITSVAAPPLAVFDVGDDALQTLVDRALARNREGRITSVADLCHELEAWRAAHEGDIGPDALPPLLGDDEPDDEVTMIQPGLAAAVRKVLESRPSATPPDPAPASAPAPAAKPEPGQPLPMLVEDASLLPIHSVITTATAADAGAEADPDDEPTASSPKVTLPAARDPQPASGPDRQSGSGGDTQRGSSKGLVIAVVVVLAVGAAAFFLTRGDGTEPSHPVAVATSAPPAASAAPPAPPVSAAPPASAPSSAAPPVSASAAPPVSAQASAVAVPVASTAAPATRPAAAGDVGACVVPLFPPNSFDAATDFSFVCSETDPRKGGAAVRTQLVRAGKNISTAMQEWALLGWYEMAAFAVLRSRCCPGAPPLELPEARGCAPVPEALTAIGKAAAATTDPSDAALKKAVDAYTTDVYCIVRSGIAGRFGRVGNPQGGEDTMFMKFLGRAVGGPR